MVSAGDDLKSAELFSTRVGSLDSRSLGLPPADILSISRGGQMALALVKDPLIQDAGTLAEASLTGGMPRPILDDVWAADWSRDGKELAVVHLVDGKRRLEYPLGNVLYESTNYIESIRVSPDGQSVAFVEWTEVATLAVVDRRKAVRTLVKDAGVTFLVCWSPRGDELWWLKKHNVSLVQSTEVHAITLSGKERVVASFPGEFNLCDLAEDGRLLVEHVTLGYKMVGRFPGEPAERNLDWLDQSTPGSLSADGKMLIFGDREDAESSKQGAYLRKTDGSPAVHLGEGSAGPFSPDGKWALVCRKLPRHYLVLIPVGAGQERVLAREAPVPNGHILFHPDGKRVLFEAGGAGQAGARLRAEHRRRASEGVDSGGNGPGSRLAGWQPLDDPQDRGQGCSAPSAGSEGRRRAPHSCPAVHGRGPDSMERGRAIRPRHDGQQCAALSSRSSRPRDRVAARCGRRSPRRARSAQAAWARSWCRRTKTRGWPGINGLSASSSSSTA